MKMSYFKGLNKYLKLEGEKQNMEGLKRLEIEVLEINDNNISKIFEYLKTRKDLYEKFNNEEKSIKEMYKYICDKARTHAKNNVAMIDDKVVYLWAITYFNKSNKELGIKQEKVILPTPTEVIKKMEKKETKKDEEKKHEENQISMFQEEDK